MATLNELTDKQFTELLDDYFKPPKERTKLTETEVRELAIFLNDKIDVPLISATYEEKILVKVVIKVDNFLYDNLPNELYDLIRSHKNGIDDDEATRLITRLTILANKKIDIPYLPEAAEHMAIKLVLQVVINAARKHWDFATAKNADEKEMVVCRT